MHLLSIIQTWDLGMFFWQGWKVLLRWNLSLYTTHPLQQLAKWDMVEYAQQHIFTQWQMCKFKMFLQKEAKLGVQY